MDISLVILNWNGEKFLNDNLPGIIKFCAPSNTGVVVIDNNSSDNSLQLLKDKFPEVKTVVLDKNYGFADGYNRGLKQIESDYFILSNSDIELKSDAITPMIELLESNPEIAAVAPKLKSMLQPEKFEYAGAAGGFIDKFGYPFCRGRILDTVEDDNGQYNNQTYIFWATGAFMAVRSSVFNLLGGFDASFFAHQEEIDLCWRMKNRGYKIVYCPQAEVFHLGGGTLAQGNPRKLYFNYRNSLKMLFKNLAPRKLFFTILFRMILDGISASIYLLKLSPKDFFAVVKAHWAFYVSLPQLIGQRRELKKSVNSYNHAEIFNSGIVFRYMIKKQKRFDLLNFK